MYSTEKKEFLCRDQDTVFLKQLHVDFISDRDKEILCDMGVPATAEPFVSFFGEDKLGGYSLKDEACKLKLISEKRIKAAGSLLDGFCVLGFTDFGGSIVIDKEGRIWAIIYFENEAELKTFVNNSLDEFLDCLYEYKKQVDLISQKHENNRDIKNVASKKDIKELEDKLLSVNGEVLNKGSFWYDEISRLKALKEEDLIEYVKPRLKALGFKKKNKRWTKETEHFTYSFYIQGSYLDKDEFFVRPGIIIKDIEARNIFYYGHFSTDITITTKEQILDESLAFFSNWTSVEYLKERVAAFAEWDKRNPLEKRRAGLVNYKADPVPEPLFYQLSQKAIEEILNLEV
ncbi:MAG: SUKH-4 family immunity protein [Clostridiales bacterium]|nr:SUKH-4 family immunity protein [Clostridiales bacterium]